MNTALTLQIGGDISRLRTELSKANGLMNGFSSKLQSIGSQLGVTFGAAGVFMGLKYGVGVMMDFEKSMSEVRAITNATDDEFKALRNSALELGRTTKYTAEEVSQLQIAFGRLGFSNTEILNSTAATLQLATATGEDLAKSADIAGSTLRAFNLEATEMQRVVDVMAASFNKSALGLDNFGEAIKYVAPVAAAANISLEETTSMLGTLADAGIRGSMAGTSLRKIISDVKEETGSLSERLQKLADKGLTGAGAMDEVGRTAYASLLILTKHIDKVNEGTEAYKNVTGEAQKMADLMSDNLAGDITKLQSAFDGLILGFSEGSGALRELVKGITELINILSNEKVITFLKDWFELVMLIPLATREAIKSVSGLFDETDKFAEMQKARKEKWLASLVGTPEEIKKTTTAIQEQAVVVKAYTKSLNDSLGFKTPNKGFFEDVSEGQFYKPEINMDPNSGLLSRDERNNPVDGIIEETRHNEELASSLEGLTEAREKDATAMKKAGDIAQEMGSAVGDAFGQAASGQKTWAQALQSLIPRILKLLLAEATASIITAGAKDGAKSGNVIVGLAAASLGAAAIGSMFSNIGAGGGGSGSGAPGRLPSESSSINVNVTGRIKGADLEVISNKNDYWRSQLG